MSFVELDMTWWSNYHNYHNVLHKSTMQGVNFFVKPIEIFDTH